ncbi:hypothetical protein SAMN02746041_02963 [Desulfacinum hydrothermale DSM 13146]|uniref:PNPLA domain-containing protein n=1 Tax=Desulfacinum hydrothermale DSM 13146 TaxID=1121390 RepID=A0A1W1XU98_9BACT|nr:patatin-like phospholipase family protein [Desulfacinum hydrothermale]SMC27467.1 hypothetical protein SAMN02746041_02963 [Desulfacinum hydrothermale DSM 13146]
MVRILSIDGGGIRGIIPAMVLAEMERLTGRRTARNFHLMAGTSTGGILAMALAVPGSDGPRFAARDLVDLYADRGRDIFKRSFWKGMSSAGGLLDEKYPHEPLERVLDEYFGDTVLSDALTKVLVSAYDIEDRAPFFFKSWRSETAMVPMKRAARATSAAPTYFEPARIRMGNETKALVDGGVFVNNPAVSAYAEARRLYPEDEEIMVVSLGTGQLTRPITYDEAKDWGLAGWAIPILNVVFDGVSDAVDYQLRQILGDRFTRFQIPLHVASDDMDNASAANITALKLEAQTLMKQRREDLERACQWLTADEG